MNRIAMQFVRNFAIPNRIFYGVFLFAAYWYVSLPEGLATNIGTGIYLPASTSLQRAAESLKISDNAYYTQTALQFISPNPLDSTGLWAIRQWPPGFPALLSAPALVVGADYPVGLWVNLLTSIAWCAVFYIIIRRCTTLIRRLLVCIAFVGTLLSPPFQGWIFDTGYLYTEGLATAAASLAILGALYVSSHSSTLRDLPLTLQRVPRAWGLAVGVGALLALCAYLRATYEFVVLLAMVMTVAVCAALLLAGLIKHHRVTLAGSPRTIRTLICCVIVVFSAQALMFPWRAYVYREFDRSTSWTIQTDVYWGLRWAPNNFLESSGNGWFSEWGGNSACRIAPDECARIASTELTSPGAYSGSGAHSQSDFKAAAVSAYAAHPLQLLADRTTLLITQWTANSYSVAGRAFWGVLFAASLLIALIAAVRFAFAGRLVLPLVFLSVIGGTIGPLMLQLVEVRYLFPAQLCSWTLVLALAAASPIHRKRRHSEL